MPPRFGALLVLLCLGLSACAPAVTEVAGPPVVVAEVVSEPEVEREAPVPAPEAEVELPPARPAWLGTRVLPLRPDGFGEIQPTPPELVDRRLPPSWVLDVPPGAGTAVAVPDDVAARSTWAPGCPVTLNDLRYVTTPFWGFDHRTHTGELLVHHSAAEVMVDVFARLHAARFPIEEMRVVTLAELDAPPTGDGNNSTGFVCRPTRGATSWSQHAYGLAVDINPFHNPYHKGDVVLPELASAYLDRANDRPGMVQPGDVVTEAFGAHGWTWGGGWASFPDYMHFSASGR